MIKAIVFDLDDTLYPEHDYVFSAFREVGNWVDASFGKTGFYEAAREQFLAGTRGTIFNEVLAKMGIAVDSYTLHAMLHVYRNHFPQISLYEDAVWALTYYERSKRLGLITDGYLSAQKNKVASLGIETHIPCIVYSDADGRESWKPSQRPYMKMMDYYGFERHEFVYVGDNPLKDFVTAKQLGWQTIRINRGNGQYCHLAADPSHEAHHTVSDLYELKKLIT
jgi:putative hydrolase of the HAD superfamily